MWVYHVKSSVMMKHPEKVIQASVGGENPYTFPEDYENVAMVAGCSAVEDAFHLTQNLSQPWTLNPSVTAVGLETNRRSSIVGDVVVCGDTAWYCDVADTWVRLDTGEATAHPPTHDYGD